MWDLSCVDWEDRIRDGRSLMPDLPLIEARRRWSAILRRAAAARRAWRAEAAHRFRPMVSRHCPRRIRIMGSGAAEAVYPRYFCAGAEGILENLLQRRVDASRHADEPPAAR
jgi:hypothetical protein